MQENSSSATPPEHQAASLTTEDAKQLFELVTDQLRAMARKMSRDDLRRTLQPTALVNEAFLRMFGKRPRSWNDEAHFIRFASVTMRNILMDQKRRKAIRERILSPTDIAFDELLAGMESRCGGDLTAVNEALDLLREEDQEIADYVSIRFFTGRTNAETTRVLGISERQGDNHWAFARAWLKTRLDE